MQREQYKEIIQRDLTLKVYDVENEIKERGTVRALWGMDKILELLIDKLGIGITLRFVELIAAKAVTDAETYLGPDVFSDKDKFISGSYETVEETQWSAAYYFQKERMFPIEFKHALETMANSFQSLKIDHGKPMKRIEVAFNKREKPADPDRLEMRFFTDKAATARGKENHEEA